jgi:FkbM family methyltransferase
MTMKSNLKRLLRYFGYDVTPILPNTDSWARRATLIQALRVDVVLDIGAHAGGFGKFIRRAGFEGTIVSFEPQRTVISELREAARRHQPWKIYECALSNFDGEADLYIENRSSSSSLRVMSKQARSMAATRITKTERVEVRRLDSVKDELQKLGRSFYLKCDAQGAEKEILQGSMGALSFVKAIEVELSLGEMYSGQWHIREALDWFDERDYELFSVEAGFADPSSGRVMQVDTIFRRRDCV